MKKPELITTNNTSEVELSQVYQEIHSDLKYLQVKKSPDTSTRNDPCKKKHNKTHNCTDPQANEYFFTHGGENIYDKTDKIEAKRHQYDSKLS